MVVNIVGVITALFIMAVGFRTALVSVNDTNADGKFIAGLITLFIGVGILAAVICNLYK